MSEDAADSKTAPEQTAPDTSAPIEETVAAPAENVSVPTGETDASAEAPRVTRGKGTRHVPRGIVHVLATFNNTKVVITDQQGNVLCWGSGGKMGYKGSRKSTSYVAQQIGTEVARKAMTMGMREVEVRLKGPGSGRESAARGVAAAGLDIALLVDVTPLPHNGCRPPKRRRV